MASCGKATHLTITSSISADGVMFLDDMPGRVTSASPANSAAVEPIPNAWEIFVSVKMLCILRVRECVREHVHPC